MRVRSTLVLLYSVVVAACSGSNSSPATPTPTAAITTPAPKLTAPTPDSPGDGSAVGSFRPTLVVRNGTSDQAGARFYEFQVSDRSDFSTAPASFSTAFIVVAHPAGVPEGDGGTTSYTPDFDLQPTTRLYWRARFIQGTLASDWSATRNLTTPITGYSRAGELYDPLVAGATIGVPVGATSFLPGRGLQLGDGNAYVRYQLQQPLSSGEFSMEIEGLSGNGPGGKLKLFSMMDGTGDLFRSNYLFSAQYRGLGGNPDNCISFKALLGDPFLKIEPDFGRRAAGVRFLDPTHGYLWKATWGNGFRVSVQDGVNGPSVYDLSLTLADMGIDLPGTYNPNPHFAYLGANNGSFGEEDGSWPQVIYRNVWVGRGPRPQSLGSALLPPQ